MPRSSGVSGGSGSGGGGGGGSGGSGGSGGGDLRLFVALVPPAAVLDHLEAAVAPLRADADLRWVEPQRWHLTLAFLGRVAPERLPDLHERLARAASRHPVLALRVSGAGRFDGRVLWAGLAGDLDPLRALATSVAAGARRARVEVDPKPMKPHLTLARARQGASIDLRPLVAALGGYAGPGWTAGEVTLMRSHLGPQPRYEPLAAWPLRAP